MKIVTVKNSIIDLDHPSFESVASAEDIAEIGTFSHFDENQKLDAEEELFQKLEETRESRLAAEDEEDQPEEEEEVPAKVMGTGDEDSAKGNFFEQDQK